MEAAQVLMQRVRTIHLDPLVKASSTGYMALGPRVTRSSMCKQMMMRTMLFSSRTYTDGQPSMVIL